MIIIWGKKVTNGKIIMKKKLPPPGFEPRLQMRADFYQGIDIYNPRLIK